MDFRLSRPSLACAVAGLLLAAFAPPADTHWSRAATEHFVVSGDAPADHVGRVAARLESLRGVFNQVIPRARDHSLLPVFVVAFDTERAFAPYRPPGVVFDGFALPDAFIPCIVLRADRPEESFRTIVHEYVHVLFDAPGWPPWLCEGMADYYSMTTVSRDGRRAVLGDRIPEHLVQASRWWEPLNQVLLRRSTDRLSNGDSSMSFYAESWLLVHYLMRATPGRGAQIARYLDLLAGGAGEAVAFEQAIGPPAVVETNLRRYLGNGIVYGEAQALPSAVSSATVRARPMTAAEVAATVGRLLFHLRRDDEAAARLGAALAAAPDLAEAQVSMGALHLRHGRRAEALAAFRRAVAAEPSNLFAAYSEGRFSLEAASGKSHPPVEEAYAALSRAVEGRAALPPEPLATLGSLAGRLGRLDEAEPLLRRADVLEPGRPGIQLELANVCLRLRKFDEARSLLTEALSKSTPASADAAAARQRREWLGLAEERARVRAELAEASGADDPGADRAIANTGSFPLPPRLRALGAGEERRLGLLDSVDCVGGEFVVRVTTRSGPVNARTAALASVHLSSARDDVSGSVGCGPRQRREAVYVTWKGEQQLVALEFLPADLSPPASPRQ